MLALGEGLAEAVYLFCEERGAGYVIELQTWAWDAIEQGKV